MPDATPDPVLAAPAAQTPIVALTGLEVHFPIYGSMLDLIRRRPKGVVRAVDGIDLTLMQGEVLALVGESGSGKTTTGRVIVKLTKQTTGRIDFEGTDVSRLWSQRELRQYRRRVQLIFQDPYETLDPKQSIRDFVAEPLLVNHIGTAAERETKVIAALEAAGLRPGSDFAARYPHELSGGQRQRVVIAGALVMDPEVIVADEPVSMLDVSIRTELLRLMLDLRVERGLTYLFITHDLSLAWVIADRIAVMYLGKIMEIGPAESVIRSPRNPYTKALVSVSPSPDPPTAGTRAARTILEGETPDAAHVPTGCRFHPRCPVAFDRCTTEEPPLFDLGGGQSAACWLAEPGGRSEFTAGGARMTSPEPGPTANVAALPPSRIADLLAASATTIVAELLALGDQAGWRPEPGEWSANECVGHLIEAERRGFAGRIRTILAAPPNKPAALEAWDPPAVAESRRDDLRSGAELAAEFDALRADGLALVRGLRPVELTRVGSHPEVGPLRVDELLGEWVHHDRNHVRQMLAVSQARVWPQMGNARKFFLAEL